MCKTGSHWLSVFFFLFPMSALHCQWLARPSVAVCQKTVKATRDNAPCPSQISPAPAESRISCQRTGTCVNASRSFRGARYENSIQIKMQFTQMDCSLSFRCKTLTGPWGMGSGVSEQNNTRNKKKSVINVDKRQRLN